MADCTQKAGRSFPAKDQRIGTEIDFHHCARDEFALFDNGGLIDLTHGERADLSRPKEGLDPVHSAFQRMEEAYFAVARMGAYGVGWR